MNFKSVTLGHIACAILLSLIALNPAKAASDAPCTFDDIVSVVKQKDGDSTFRIILNPPQALEATIRLDFDLQNMTAAPSEHFDYYVDGFHHPFMQPIEIARMTRVDANHAFHYRWHYRWVAGLPGAKPDMNYVYALPYRSGEHYRINQGYFGTYSHQRGTTSQYALDFNLPEGTPVCAARDGIVIESRGSSTLGGPDRKFEECGNLIMIKHSDGTYGRYFHLKPGGNLARAGQPVRKGEVIGLSGHTGFADRPHLHFTVSVVIDGATERTIPTMFQTEHGIVSELKEGETY